MKLSVIIVNYNVKYFLQLALQSAYRSIAVLEESYGPGAADVWVVDNNSMDGSVEMVAREFPQVRLIANKQNTGFSYANNQAIRESTAEYVLLLNPDTVVQEDTFRAVVAFMDAHPDGGGLGIKMVEGKGEFLPESKRGFPSPAVAFYKIFGLSRLFPKSRTFGKYHLGYLSDDEVHPVDVLAGAFMLLRRKALDEVGLLDETFFMYGEDIDLSYRIVKGGYKNYYFPDAEIIHYKGESTKKSSINYVFVFYQAMVIFARKHLPKGTAAAFALLINAAIWLRAGAAIVSRMLRRLAMPALDAAALYGGMYLLVRYWERTIKYIDGGKYPPELLHVFVPVYIAFWIAGLFLAGGYRRPYRARRVFAGALLGTVLLSVFYAFLSEDYRFSRAFIILGGGVAALVFLLTRIGFNLLRHRTILVDEKPLKRILIAGRKDECDRVVSILEKTQLKYLVVGYIQVDDAGDGEGAFLGRLEQADRMVNIYKADELIFCARDLSYGEIIRQMQRLRSTGVDYKIVPEDSPFVIGSNSKNEPGDYYTFNESFAVTEKDQRINKRLLDAGTAVMLLLSFPFNFWFVRHTGQYLSNLWSVLRGRKTWVGYGAAKAETSLPDIRPGVLSPADELPLNDLDEQTIRRLDYLYAKEYSIYKDLAIIAKGFNKLGKS